MRTCKDCGHSKESHLWGGLYGSCRGCQSESRDEKCFGGTYDDAEPEVYVSQFELGRKATTKEILKEVDRKIEQCKRSFNSGTDKECRHGVMVLEELKGFIKKQFGIDSEKK
jgi:hypothetical protein